MPSASGMSRPCAKRESGVTSSRSWPSADQSRCASSSSLSLFDIQSALRRPCAPVVEQDPGRLAALACARCHRQGRSRAGSGRRQRHHRARPRPVAGFIDGPGSREIGRHALHPRRSPSRAARRREGHRAKRQRAASGGSWVLGARPRPWPPIAPAWSDAVPPRGCRSPAGGRSHKSHPTGARYHRSRALAQGVGEIFGLDLSDGLRGLGCRSRARYADGLARGGGRVSREEGRTALTCRCGLIQTQSAAELRR